MKSNSLSPGVLAVLALFVWFRDTAWFDSWDSALIAAAGFPLFIALGRPWALQSEQRQASTGITMFGVGALVLGLAVELTVLMALGWMLLLWSWLSPRLTSRDRPRVRRLLVFPFLAFPWVILDCWQVGWWFRLSGSWMTEVVLSPVLNVVRNGTLLVVDGFPVDVSEACAGLNTLQALLIVGVAVLYTRFGTSRGYWVSLLMVVPITWLANTLRIGAICLVGATCGREFVSGAFHSLGGAVVIMLTFLLCCMFPLPGSLKEKAV